MIAPWQAAGNLTVNGKTLDYACLGPAPQDAATLVLLHEGLGAVALWRDFPQALQTATGLGVFAYSRAGYGQSDPADLPRPLDYMTREALEVLPQVLEAVATQRIILVGHSDGATIAALYAGRLRDPRVQGVVLLAPHTFTEPMGLAEIARARAQFETGDLRARMAKYHRDPDNAFRGWCDAWLDPDFARWDVQDALDGVTAPILAIQGNDDAYGTLAQIDAVKARCKGLVDTLILDACGHAPFRDQPERVLAAMSSFAQNIGV